MSSVSEVNFNAKSFNARIEVTELLTKTLENVSKDLASRCIKECGLRYGFNSDEAIRELGLENLSLLKKKMSRKGVGVGVSSNDKKEKKEKKLEEGLRFPMPFVRKSEDNTVCLGLSFNRGLFTQCLKKHMENGDFCKGCQSEADKNASGCPDCGTVESRLNSGLYEFKDPKGRSPVSYVKVLNKMKVSCEEAIASAKKMGLEIPEEHLTVIEKANKSSISRGRPKKVSGAVEAENVTDLFKKLSFDNAVIDDDTDDTEEPVSKKTVKGKLTDEERAAKRDALEKEREAKKEEREAERKAEAEKKKAEREAKLATEKAVREAEREAKLATEKAEREAKRKAEKEAKGAKAEEKKVKKSDNKDVVAVAPKPVPTVTANPVPNPVVDAANPVPNPVEETKTKTTVTRIQISGKQYLKSSANILYDPDTKEEVGLWNPITKKIEELPEDEDEEEEEEDEYE
jgi:hypothetical protein